MQQDLKQTIIKKIKLCGYASSGYCKFNVYCIMAETNIYILIDPISNQIRYVGKANNVKERYKNHKNRCRDLNTHKRNWINKLRLKDLYPILEVIDIVPITEWKYWERFWIAYYKSIGCNLTNLMAGGEGSEIGNKTSFKKGNIPWNFGKANKKKCLQCGLIFNISASRADKRLCCSRKCSTVYRKENGLYKGIFEKGVSVWNKDKTGYALSGLKKAKKVIQYSKDGVFIKEHRSCKDAAFEMGCSEENIRFACIGKIKMAKKHIFKFKT